MSDNQNFFFTFGAVLAFLFAFTIGIFIIASKVANDDSELSAVALERLEKNTAPLGAVYTDASAIPAAKPAASAEPRSSAQVVTGICAACHASGVLGALKLDDTIAWKGRLDAVGLKGLVATAIAGKGSMPPRGGDPTLTDEDVRAAVEHMLKQAGL